MTEERNEKILEHIEATINQTVNGKLDALKQLINEQNVVMERHMASHQVNDELQKETNAKVGAFIDWAKPYVQAAENNNIFYTAAERKGKNIIFFSVFLASVTGIVLAIKGWLK